MKYASPSKLWIAEGGKTLVPDGDARAVALFARAGEEIQESDLSKFTNGREAFGIVVAAIKAEEPAEVEKTESEESPAETTEEEKPRRGRPRK